MTYLLLLAVLPLAFFLLHTSRNMAPAPRNPLGVLASREEWLPILEGLPDLTETSGRIPAFFCAVISHLLNDSSVLTISPDSCAWPLVYFVVPRMMV